jgi:aminoglycoside 2''-phosphotransferase
MKGDEFSLENIKLIIARDYPALEVYNIKVLGEGMDNIAIEVNDLYVFRFRKNKSEVFDAEIKLLNHLRGKMSLKIPEIEFTGIDPQYMGYKKIPGTILTESILDSLNIEQRRKLVHDYANFLYEIHTQISPAKARQLGVREDRPERFIKKFTLLDTTDLDPNLISFLSKCVGEFRDSQTNLKLEDISCLHGDMGFGNEAFDTENQQLIGIYDFGDLLIGDFNQDFEVLLKNNSTLFDEVVEEYQNLSNRIVTKKRVLLFSVMFQIHNLVKKQADKNSEKYKKSLDKLISYSQL